LPTDSGKRGSDLIKRDEGGLNEKGGRLVVEHLPGMSLATVKKRVNVNTTVAEKNM
jgi:hypothetical protein